MITDEKKDEIRATADIVEVVGEYVRLKKSGSGFTGLCPFHTERTPSFHVTPGMGIYKCFGCGASGDIFSFVMEMEGISFPESMRMLADRYGISLPEPGEESGRQSELSRQREGIYHVLRFAGLWFHTRLLEEEEAEPARNYLLKRGYPKKIWRSFGLGYAPRGNALLNAALKEGFKEEVLLQADLIKESNRGSGYYDAFRERLMFPIFNPSGKLIAFAGRILDEKKRAAKYINSSQTPVYNKSEVVYGVNFARNEIRKEKEVILVEGYTDVITMHQYGIKNVVASSGTSLTPGQLQILQRYGKRIIMIYDSDSAGQAAMERGMDIALEQGMEVELMELPSGQDPDSFVKQFGRDSFFEFKREHAEDFITFSIHKAEKEGKMESPAGRAEVIRQIIESISGIPEELERQLYIQHLHQKTQVYRKGSDRELFQQLERVLAENRQRRRFRKQGEGMPTLSPAEADGSRAPVPKTRRPVRKKGSPPKYELEMIRLLLVYGEQMRRFVGHTIGEDHFEDDLLKLFFRDIMKRQIEGSEISVDHYMDRESPFPSLLADILVEQHTVSKGLAKVTGGVYQKDRNPVRTAKATLKSLRLAYLQRKREEIPERLKRAGKEERQKLIEINTRIQKEFSRIQKTAADDLFDESEFFENKGGVPGRGTFHYQMKSKE